MTPQTLDVAVAGLGRMGKRHALHFLNRTPRASLVAASTPDNNEHLWAKTHLEPFGVTLYKDYDEMLEQEGIQAVVVASVTTVHAEQAIKATEKNLHVLCEKPLSTSVEVSQSVVTAAAKKPHLKMDNGLIGRPSIFRSQTCDKLDPSGFFVAYAEFSGGIFVDCSIHDIDLALWFFGQDSQVKSVTSSGITAVQPELRKHKDVDNAVGIVEFYGGKIAYLFASRMMAAGQDDATEVIGTEGKLTINAQPMKNLVGVYSSLGVSREIPRDYYGRFENAFVTEANEFTECCLENKKLSMKLSGAVQAVAIGVALQEALNTGKKIYFDETGRRVETASL